MNKIGRYQLVAELAKEPLGDLHAGRSAGGGDQGRMVAVRRVPREMLSEEEAHRLGEAVFAAMEVRHPKVAAVLDLVMDATEVAVASEYVEGETLRSLMAEFAARRSGVSMGLACHSIFHTTSTRGRAFSTTARRAATPCAAIRLSGSSPAGR